MIAPTERKTGARTRRGCVRAGQRKPIEREIPISPARDGAEQLAPVEMNSIAGDHGQPLHRRPEGLSGCASLGGRPAFKIREPSLQLADLIADRGGVR